MGSLELVHFGLLSKTELQIAGVSLENANLNEIAVIVADTLGVENRKVIVTDVRDGILTIDILEGNIDPSNIIGKEHLLVQRLAQLSGVHMTKKPSIASRGMLGWIAFDHSKVRSALKRSQRIAEEICQRLSKRAIVFSTGSEVGSGQVEDTNTPVVVRRLEAEGYSVTSGPTLKDDELIIAANLRQAVDDGYGLVVVTGGVGAEEKDQTIDAVLALDPEAVTPYICKYEKGVGRHCKDGVMIAVAQASKTLIVALPGPNEEVKPSLEILVEGLRSRLSKHYLAEKIASSLKRSLWEKLSSEGDCKK